MDKSFLKVAFIALLGFLGYSLLSKDFSLDVGSNGLMQSGSGVTDSNLGWNEFAKADRANALGGSVNGFIGSVGKVALNISDVILKSIVLLVKGV